MKTYSKIFLLIIVFSLLVLTANAQVTSVATPEDINLNWATQIGSGWQKPAGVPIFVENNIVIMAGNEIYKLDPNSGEIFLTGEMAQAQSYGYIAPTYAEDKIFMNLSNGTVQAFDAHNLTPIWTYTDSLGGKGMSAVTYSDNIVFTGFWNKETTDASFVALNSETGALLWKKTVNGGFYWAGAYCTDNEVIFPTDDGTDKIAHIYSCNKFTGEVISSIDVEEKGDIRSSIAYSNGRIFATTKGGYIISAALNNGHFSDIKYGEIGAASTSTPVVYGDRIYIGAGDKTISVFSTDTLEKTISINVSAYPQCTPLISSHYVDTDGYLYLYTTYNKTPGGVTLIKIKPDATSAEDFVVKELYDAKGYAQYCISDIICDKNGTLYYKNDSGYLFSLTDKRLTVNASLTEDGFIMPKTELKISSTLAEDFGYTDTVLDDTSALDVLVGLHKNMFGADFTPQTASEYLSVSEEGYLSKVIGIDTYSFGFAINGKTPHDDVLTDYGYTGYSLNQAAVNESDFVEFFIYRDSWAMDNYINFEVDGVSENSISVKKGEVINLTLKAYPIGWYGCYDDSQIENMKFPLSNTQITYTHPDSDKTEIVGFTDSSGNIEINCTKVGKYIISATESEGDTPIIAPWFEINVQGIDVNVNTEEKTVEIVSNQEEERACYIIIGDYTGNTLNDSIVKKAILPINETKKSINISNLNGEVKVYVWDKNLTPIE